MMRKLLFWFLAFALMPALSIGKDIYVWQGDFNGEWRNHLNWKRISGPSLVDADNYPGQNQPSKDEVIIDYSYPNLGDVMDDPVLDRTGMQGPTFTIGALTISDGNLTIGSMGSLAFTMVIDGDVFIEGGTLTLHDSNQTLSFEKNLFQSGGTIDLNGGTITNPASPSTGKIEQSGGVINGGSGNILVVSFYQTAPGGALNIVTGSLTVTDLTIVNDLFLNGGTISVNNDFTMTGGMVNVLSGMFSVTHDLSKSNGTIELNGGMIKINNDFSHTGGMLDLKGNELSVGGGVELVNSGIMNGTINSPRFTDIFGSTLTDMTLEKNGASSKNDESFGANSFTGTCVIDNQSTNSWTWQTGNNANDHVLGTVTFLQSGGGTMTLGNKSSIIIANTSELILEQIGSGDLVTAQKGDIKCSGNITVSPDPMGIGSITFGDGIILMEGGNEKVFSTDEPISIQTLSMGEVAPDPGDGGFVGKLSLSGDFMIRDELRMNDGFIDPAGGSLTLKAGATSVIGNDQSFVIGPLNFEVLPRKAPPQNIEFPIGLTGLFRPVDLVLRFDADEVTPVIFTAELINSGPPTLTLPAELENVSTIRHWKVDCPGCMGITEATIELDFRNADQEGVSDRANLRIAKTNADENAWVNLGGDDINHDNVITSTINFTEFSRFALANAVGGANVLPVELLHFTATPDGADVHLSWATATETGNDYFLVEHSTDATHFEALTQVAGAGNSQTPRDYAYVHEQPGPGIHYYRLKQVDYDGSFEYSKVVTAKVGGDVQLRIFPNPAAGRVRVTGPAQALQYTLFDATGRMLRRSPLTPPQQIDVADLPEGVYTLRLETQEGQVLATERIVKQQ
jgi:hypothetical protein